MRREAASTLRGLSRPVFLIGAARSGTTMLGDILSQHRDIAYWVEPNYIWRYRAARNPNDVRLPSDATDQVRAYILTRFSRFVERRGKTRFMEKTPSNCFRIPFIQEVFPDGKFLHLIRDGRDATFSAEKKWMSRLDHTAFRRRVLSREIPLADLPNYSAAILRDTVGRMVMPQAGFIWGPRFPRIREIRASRSVLETCAIQWRESVRAVLAARQQLPEAQYMELRFEDLVCRPDEWISTILEFLELEVDGRVQEFAARCVRSSVANKWRKRSHEEVEGFLPLIVDLLRDLGYAD